MRTAGAGFRMEEEDVLKLTSTARHSLPTLGANECVWSRTAEIS